MSKSLRKLAEEYQDSLDDWNDLYNPKLISLLEGEITEKVMEIFEELKEASPYDQQKILEREFKLEL